MRAGSARSLRAAVSAIALAIGCSAPRNEPAEAGGQGAGGSSASGGSSANATGGTAPAPAGGGGTSPAASPPDGPTPDQAPPAPETGPLDLATGEPPPNLSSITAGFTQRPFEFAILSPHNIPRSERYTYDAATRTHTMWILSTDASFDAADIQIDPRTEMSWTTTYGPGGQFIFESDLWIAPGTDRTAIMQIYATNPPTAFMLSAWKDGTLRYYLGLGDGPIIKTDALGKWMNLKILHDTVAHQVTVYIDDQRAMAFGDRGQTIWFFKNGVYATRSRSETRWRDIRYWVKEPAAPR